MMRLARVASWVAKVGGQVAKVAKVESVGEQSGKEG